MAKPDDCVDRAAAFIVILLGALMLVVPSSAVGSQETGFSVAEEAQSAAVISTTNALPTDLAWTTWPADPTVGEIVYFNGSATDADAGDTLNYSWDFGDNTIAAGQNVTHRFNSGEGSYAVTMSVDDGNQGPEPRPATRTETLQVSSNSPPLISVPDFVNVVRGLPYTFSVTASDVDVRDVLKFTWDWGDGEVSVTMTSSAIHTYHFLGNYILTVWTDDGTGISSPPHNVSDTGRIAFGPPQHHPPTLPPSGFTVSDTTPWIGQMVTFYATPTDVDGDILDVTITFGDGASYMTTQSAPNTTVTVSHVYSTEDDFFPSVTFTDLITSPVTVYPTWYISTTVPSFDLDLVAGWNFVCVPFTGYDYMASDLVSGPGDMVVEWDPIAQAYGNTYFWSFGEVDFPIEASVGYWVYSSVPRTVAVMGSYPSAVQSRVIDVPDGDGWATVGFMGLNSSRWATDLVGMFTGTIVLVVAWDPVLQDYGDTCFPDWSEGDFQLTPGMCYWIYFLRGGTLSYLP